MARPEILERQPLLFPVGDLGPPDGPAGTAVACGAADDDEAWEAVLGALARLMVRGYCQAQVAKEAPPDA